MRREIKWKLLDTEIVTYNRTMSLSLEEILDSGSNESQSFYRIVEK